MSTPACEYAKLRHQDFRRWRQRWTYLLFAFGISVVAFLSLVILLFVAESWASGAVALVGTIANGAAIAWVTARRAESVREEEAAYEDVKRQCFASDPQGLQAYRESVGLPKEEG
ncbi:MAG TPA: hypothetical protein VKD90_25395 [Gemmataceae bacterium]|nr:hypothetical protein [Gemmataceae bacterium]